MTAGKFENVSMIFTPSTPNVSGTFNASGLGPDNGRGKSGDVSFLYKNNNEWIKFAEGQCAGYEHTDPNEIFSVQQASPYPKGEFEVVVCFTSDGSPPNTSSSDPKNINFI